MAQMGASGFSAGYTTGEDPPRRCSFSWDVEYDSTTKVLTVLASTDHGAATATLTLIRTDNSDQTFDLIALGILDAGLKTFNNVNLKTGSSKNGVGVVSVRGDWTPPATYLK